MIDLFLTNQKSTINDVKAVPSVSLDADHRLVIAKLKIKIAVKKAGSSQKRFNLVKLKERDTKDALVKKLEDNFQDNVEEIGIEASWLRFKKKVLGAAADVLGERSVYKGKKKATLWWTENVQAAVRDKMRAFRRWMKTRQPEDRPRYEISRKNTERVKKVAKQDMWAKIGSDLEEDLSGTKKLLYSMAKSYRGKNKGTAYAIKDKSNNLLTEPEEIAKRWGEYFMELLNIRDDEGASQELEENEILSEDDGNDSITVEEVRQVMKQMKNRKAPGDDGIPFELLGAGGECIVQQLLKMFNIAYRSESVPLDWQRGVICPLFKKGDKTSCDNYRGITLLSHAGKLYNRIIERRLQSHVEEVILECQHGFRLNRGTVDLVFTIKMILEKSWEWNKDKFALFIDLEKAFDRVKRSTLWKVLKEERYNIPPKLIRVIKNLYSQSWSKVRGRDLESNWFEIETGVRQGDVLSPLLFIIFMDSCARDLGVAESSVETLMYADDVAVIANSIEEIQSVANSWYEGTKQNGMKINTRIGKTEIMAISRSPNQYDVFIGEDKINQTDNDSYLGVCVNDGNLQERESNERISKYTTNVGMMYPLLKDRHVPRQSKIIIYKTILKPILLYGAETWSLTTKTQSKLQAAEMRVLRLIKGVTRRGRCKNADIRKEVGVGSIIEDIERSKLRWYGHVMRMSDDRLPKKYLTWVPEGSRPTGRPRKRWIDGLKAGMSRRSRTLEEIEHVRLYDDRDAWRAFWKSSS